MVWLMGFANNQNALLTDRRNNAGNKTVGSNTVLFYFYLKNLPFG